MTDLYQRIANLPPEKRALLERHLLQKDAGAGQEPLIPRRGATGPCPASFAQQRLWFLDQLQPGAPFYNTGLGLRLTGRLDGDALQQALDAILARHEALRTTLVTMDGAPFQVIAEPRPVDVARIDLRECPAATREEEATRLLHDEAQRPFDLARDLMLRATLVRLGEEEHLLLLVIHHIASDAWSEGVLFRELAAFYAGFTAGRPVSLPELPIQYADFAVWQREWLQGERLEAQLRYWKQQLDGAPALLALPVDRPRPAAPTFRGEGHFLLLPRPLTEALRKLSQREGVTLFMTLLAAWQTLLMRYTGQDDIVVGSPIANREAPEIEGLIGFFVNTLALRSDLSGDPTFRELLARVRTMALAAYAHQDLPFEKLVAEIQPDRATNRAPLFQVMFAIQHAPEKPLELPGLSVSPVALASATAKFDLIFRLAETGGTLLAALQYSTELFDRARIERMLAHFRQLLEGIVADPNARLSRLPLLTEAERLQLLVTWNETERAYPRERCLHHLFEEQAARTPDVVAVSFGKQQWTYQELNSRANQLAHHLRRLGVGPEVRVGLCVERSPEMVVGLLGILKAGGAYVPLDATYPRERLAFMLADAQVTVLLTQQRMAASLPPHAGPILRLDADWERITGEEATNPDAGTAAENLAYVIYTSGSTGVPKGVAVPHRAVLRLVCHTDYVPITPAERVAQASNVSFDAATFEIWGALLHGACLVGLSREDLLAPERLAATLQQERISVLFLTTALFNQIARTVPDAFRSVRHLLFGGEAADPRCAAAVLRHGPPERLLHVYGPTETTTFATWHHVESVPADATTIPIGRPIANTQLYVLDRALQPVPVGVPGELYIGGDGVARGYLDRPELTAERFIPNSFLGEGSRPATLYRTGDQVRYRPDGNLEFLGRLDDQVKVRGFRVEPGEIEAVLGRHPAVSGAAVIARKDAHGEQQLVAYVVVRGEGADTTGDRPPAGVSPGWEAEGFPHSAWGDLRRSTASDRLDLAGVKMGEARSPALASVVTGLRRFTREQLPEYAVPAAFVILDTLPVTANGKIDRRALPAPAELSSTPATGVEAPRDTVEMRLAEIWAELLELPSVGVTEDFFELGGHSLMTVRLRAQIEAAFGRSLPLVTLFQARTIAQQAVALRRESDPVADGPLVPFHPEGSRPPFFCVYPTLGDVPGFCALARWLDHDQPFYGLQIPDAEGKPPETMRIDEMAARFITAIRGLQPQGPYLLGGYCFGALVAFEMAQQLQADGQSVDLLCLLDPSDPPGVQPPAAGEAAHSVGAVTRSDAGAGRIMERILGMIRRRAQMLPGWWSRHTRMLEGLAPRERCAYVVAKLQDRLAWHTAQVLYRPYRSCRTLLPHALRMALWDRLWRHTLFNAFRDARRQYVMQRYPGRVTLLRATQHPARADGDEGSSCWQPWCTEPLEFHAIPGDHLSIFADPHVQVLARALTDCLHQARAEPVSAPPGPTDPGSDRRQRTERGGAS